MILKFLIACAPSGDIMMISPVFGGHATDSEIVDKSRLVEYLYAGARVLADKGFPRIVQLFGDKGIFVTMPPRSCDGEQFTTEENQLSYDIACLRKLIIYIEMAFFRQ